MNVSRRAVTHAAVGTALGLGLGGHTAAANALVGRGIAYPTEAGTDDLAGLQLLTRLTPPPAPADGRGAALEALRPALSTTYATSPTLSADVTMYRDFHWSALYPDVERKARALAQGGDPSPARRLQADVYMYNGQWAHALSSLDAVLRHHTRCIHATSMTSLLHLALGNTAEATVRMDRLVATTPKAAAAMKPLLALAATAASARCTTQPQRTTAPNVIAVLGQGLSASGAPSLDLRSRLDHAALLARRYSAASIVVTGGPVESAIAPATVMASWLARRGVAPTRITTDALALDVVGQAMGIVAACQSAKASAVLLVTSSLQAGTALAAVRAYGTRVGWQGTADAVGIGAVPRSSAAANQRVITFVQTARAAGLYEWGDFQKFKG